MTLKQALAAPNGTTIICRAPSNAVLTDLYAAGYFATHVHANRDYMLRRMSGPLLSPLEWPGRRA